MRTTEVAAPAGSMLALVPGKGLVRICDGGCVHVTYGAVTLDFHLREHFEVLLCQLQRQPAEPTGRMHLRHGHALLTFTAAEYQDFAAMVREAGESLIRLDAVRKLLVGVGG